MKHTHDVHLGIQYSHVFLQTSILALLKGPPPPKRSTIFIQTESMKYLNNLIETDRITAYKLTLTFNTEPMRDR